MSGATMMLMGGGSSGGGGGGGGGGAFLVTINPGETAGVALGSHTFSTNSFTASGGTGPYVGTWSNTNDGYGTWNGPATGATFAPHVSHMAPGDRSVATYVCIVLDATLAVGISNNAVYTFTDTSTV